MTDESEIRLKLIYSNLKNFFILNVADFISGLNIDISKRTSIYLVNTEITKLIMSLAKLKKYVGIIYITNDVTKRLHDTMRQNFSNNKDISKFVLIDNGQFPKHSDLYSLFDEVIFYERFRKNKIIECNGFEKNNETNSLQLLMDDLPENK